MRKSLVSDEWALASGGERLGLGRFVLKHATSRAEMGIRFPLSDADAMTCLESRRFTSTKRDFGFGVSLHRVLSEDGNEEIEFCWESDTPAVVLWSEECGRFKRPVWMLRTTEILSGRPGDCERRFATRETFEGSIVASLREHVEKTLLAIREWLDDLDEARRFGLSFLSESERAELSLFAATGWWHVASMERWLVSTPTASHVSASPGQCHPSPIVLRVVCGSSSCDDGLAVVLSGEREAMIVKTYESDQDWRWNDLEGVVAFVDALLAVERECP